MTEAGTRADPVIVLEHPAAFDICRERGHPITYQLESDPATQYRAYPSGHGATLPPHGGHQ